MSEELTDIDIKIDDDPAAAPEGATAPAQAAKPEGDQPTAATAPDPDEALEGLKRDLAAERSGRISAEATAARAAEDAARARGEVQDTNLQMITNAIETAKGDIASLKLQYRQVRADGDVDAEFDIQNQLSRRQAELVQLEAGEVALKAQPKPKPPVAAVTDAAEALAGEMARLGSPRSAAWIRAHPQYARDPRLNRKMIVAHDDATDAGLTIDTPEYIAHIERSLGLAADPGQTEDPALSGAAQPTGRRSPAAPSPAPPSRSGDPPGRNTSNTVRLTAAEREAAKVSGLTEQEYAREKLRIERETQTTH